MTTYTGTKDALCPITLNRAHELTHPVAFKGHPSQPYELAPLWKWVLASDRHPLTGRACSLNDIVALRGAREGNDRVTDAVLEGMQGLVHTHITLKYEFKQRLHELETELNKMNESIIQAGEAGTQDQERTHRVHRNEKED